MLYASSIFCPDLHGSPVSDDIFPSVASYMVIDSQLKGPKQGGFAVITASDYQGYALRDTHAPDPSPVGKLKLNCQLLRRLKCHRFPHGLLGHSRFSGKNAAVCREGTEPKLREPRSDIGLILCKIAYGLKLFWIGIFI